jgi:hypothetical protein
VNFVPEGKLAANAAAEITLCLHCLGKRHIAARNYTGLPCLGYNVPKNGMPNQKYSHRQPTFLNKPTLIRLKEYYLANTAILTGRQPR